MDVWLYIRDYGKPNCVDEQLEIADRWATRMQLEVTRTYVEKAGCYGKMLVTRPGFELMLRAVRPGDMVVFPDLISTITYPEDILGVVEVLSRYQADLRVLDLFDGDVDMTGPIAKALFDDEYSMHNLASPLFANHKPTETAHYQCCMGYPPIFTRMILPGYNRETRCLHEAARKTRYSYWYTRSPRLWREVRYIHLRNLQGHALEDIRKALVDGWDEEYECPWLKRPSVRNAAAFYEQVVEQWGLI